jgi:hypothetical protein
LKEIEMNTSSRLLLLSSCLALAGAPLGAAEAKAAKPKPAQPAAASSAAPAGAVGASGYVVGRDPVTGELVVPAPSDVQNMMVLSAPRDLKPISYKALRNGGEIARLNGRFLHYMKAEQSADGKVSADCRQEEEAAHGTR